jgi:hypothetical protein
VNLARRRQGQMVAWEAAGASHAREVFSPTLVLAIIESGQRLGKYTKWEANIHSFLTCYDGEPFMKRLLEQRF